MLYIYSVTNKIELTFAACRRQKYYRGANQITPKLLKETRRRKTFNSWLSL